MDSLLGKKAHELVTDGTLGKNLYPAAQISGPAGDQIYKVSCKLVVKGAGICAGSTDAVVFNKKDITFRIADDTHAGLVAAFVGEHGAEDALGNQLFQNGSGPVVFETYYRSSSPAYNADFLRA